MGTIDWNDGRLIHLTPGETATCKALNQQQLYGLIFYNSAINDTGADLMVNWSNAHPPLPVHVPGTTARQGLASVVFVSGDDTTTVGVSVQQNQPGVQLQSYIASVKMPVNTNGINNQPLSPDGQNNPFKAFTRFYAVPESHWYWVEIVSDVNQFISVMFTSQHAVVSVANPLVDPNVNVYAVGSATSKYSIELPDSGVPQIVKYPIQGNGQQRIWVNADSVQNSQRAFISLQSLAARVETDSLQLIGAV